MKSVSVSEDIGILTFMYSDYCGAHFNGANGRLEKEIYFRIAHFFEKLLTKFQNELLLRRVDGVFDILIAINQKAQKENLEHDLIATTYPVKNLETLLLSTNNELFLNYLQMTPAKTFIISRGKDNSKLLSKFHKTIEKSIYFKKTENNEDLLTSFNLAVKEEIDRHLSCIYRIFQMAAMSEAKNKKDFAKIKDDGETRFEFFFHDIFLKNESFFKKYTPYRTSYISQKHQLATFKTNAGKRRRAQFLHLYNILKTPDANTETETDSAEYQNMLKFYFQLCQPLPKEK